MSFYLFETWWLCLSVLLNWIMTDFGMNYPFGLSIETCIALLIPNVILFELLYLLLMIIFLVWLSCLLAVYYPCRQHKYCFRPSKKAGRYSNNCSWILICTHLEIYRQLQYRIFQDKFSRNQSMSWA